MSVPASSSSDAGSPGAFPVRADHVRIVLTTAPPDRAQELARALVEERLAACVNVLPGVRSLYWWQGTVQDDPESVLLVKTRHDGLQALAQRLEALHPYEVPELLVLAPEGGSAAYLDWVAAETGLGGDPAQDDPEGPQPPGADQTIGG